MNNTYDNSKESTAKIIPMPAGYSNLSNLDLSKLARNLETITDMYNTSQEAFDVKLQKHIEQKKLLEKKFNIEIQKQAELNKMLERENALLKTTVRHLETSLKKCIPTHIILFLIINAILMTLSLAIALLYYNVHLILFDIYYVWCTFIISMTLFCTAFRSLIDWRKMLNEK